MAPFRLEEMESYNRVLNIPIVNSGLNIAENVYTKIKKSNDMIGWSLDQAEDTIKAVVHNPAIGLLESPLNTLDHLICKGLDIVESTVPCVNLPPERIYSNTRGYITDVGTKIVRPVLKRADSMKQIGNNVLTSKYTEYAADKLDDALDVADAYIDKYFPDQDDQKDSNDMITGTKENKATHTMKHAERVSRKLQRRLTKRTLEHAKIIKEQSTEAIHVLFYVAELIVTDPKLALQKAKELWIELSKDEPENQARPKNVEELFVLVVRESTRKLVHLVNYCSGMIAQMPKNVSKSTHDATAFIIKNTEALVKLFHLEGIENYLIASMRRQKDLINFVLQEINKLISQVLDKSRQPEIIENITSKAVLTVPKLELNLKASSNKTDEKSNENHGHHGNHRLHGHHGHHGKKNGSHSPSNKKAESEHN